jgi:hypothetical protein
MSDLTERAAQRLEAMANMAPGYAAALVNLAGDITMAGSGGDCEHGGMEWANRVAAIVLGVHDG